MLQNCVYMYVGMYVTHPMFPAGDGLGIPGMEAPNADRKICKNVNKLIIN